jgi:hypothetical protein
MTDKEAMKLALEALERLTGAWQTFDALDYGDNAIAALKEAMADPMREVQRLGQEIEQESPERTWVGLTDEEKIDCANFDYRHENIDFNQIKEVHKAANKIGVGYSLNYRESDDSWFFTIDSVSPDEYWCGKNHSFDIAVICVLEQLELFEIHDKEKT